jgi:hypothetical protein
VFEEKIRENHDQRQGGSLSARPGEPGVPGSCAHDGGELEGLLAAADAPIAVVCADKTGTRSG